ncbi:TF2AY factor, partial [Psilopogon haemacephalus]|nr:TF2AY factor [Psilopogon haemacephalus]
KFYKSIIEDVIEGVRELFAEEGLEEQVLQDLKQLWETKVMQSKATEGFFRHSHRSPQFTVQLPHNFHQILQASAASLIIPTGRGFQPFTAADLGTSQIGATLTLPPSLAYPIHVPAGVTLQTASGQLYKVNVPIMVAQASGDGSILHPVQQLFQPLGQPSLLQANTASLAQGSAASAQAAAETVQPREPAVQQTMVLQLGAVGENSASAALVQKPPVSQQRPAADAVVNQCPDPAGEPPQQANLHTAVFTPEASKGFASAESLANNSGSVLQDIEGQLELEPQELAQEQVSDDIIDLIIMGKDMDDGTLLKCQDSTAASGKMEPTEQMESNLQSEKDICGDIEGIIQLDGTGDVSPKEEIPHRDREENLFVGINESEDLKDLEDNEDNDEECVSVSNTESSSSGGDDEELQADVVEEDPLNSDDDVSEQDTPDLFDTDNVIVCQYDKIQRSKNKWKFFLKDGVMAFEGKEHVFAKAVGDAEW